MAALPTSFSSPPAIANVRCRSSSASPLLAGAPLSSFQSPCCCFARNSTLQTSGVQITASVSTGSVLGSSSKRPLSSCSSSFCGLSCEFSFLNVPRFGRSEECSIRRKSATLALAHTADPVTRDLPVKLQEIVKLFQQVNDSRAKYEQLLYYANKLKPLAKEFCTNEYKVEGCVSQVWVKPTLNVEDNTVLFEANSDSMLTKGLAALLVEGLSGSSVSDVLKVTPDFIQMLGLKQSLTASRSNGFLNTLKLMQKKTLQLYMDAEAAKSGSEGNSRQNAGDLGVSVPQATGIQNGTDNGGSSDTAVGPPEQRSMKSSIEMKLQDALAPTVLVVDDVSHQHAGHAGVHKGATETHFNVKVVSDKFTGSSLIKRHRLIYDLLDEELKNGVHALSLVTKSPSEAGS